MAYFVIVKNCQLEMRERGKYVEVGMQEVHGAHQSCIVVRCHQAYQLPINHLQFYPLNWQLNGQMTKYHFCWNILPREIIQKSLKICTKDLMHIKDGQCKRFLSNLYGRSYSENRN